MLSHCLCSACVVSILAKMMSIIMTLFSDMKMNSPPRSVELFKEKSAGLYTSAVMRRCEVDLWFEGRRELAEQKHTQADLVLGWLYSPCFQREATWSSSTSFILEIEGRCLDARIWETRQDFGRQLTNEGKAASSGHKVVRLIQHRGWSWLFDYD